MFCKKYILTGIAFCLITGILWAGQLPVVVVDEESPESMGIGAFVGLYPMQEGQFLSPAEITALPDSMFFSFDELDQIPNHHSAWIKISFANHTERIQARYAVICPDHLELNFFGTDSEGRLSLLARGGYEVHPNRRLIPSLDNLFFIHLEPGEERAYYIHSKIKPGHSYEHYFHLALQGDLFDYIRTELHQSSLQSFLSGILVVFAVVGIILFLSFRERIFLYFSGLMLFLSIYFTSQQVLLTFVLNLPPEFMYRYTTSAALTGVTFFSYLFSVKYLDLQRLSPLLFKLLSAIALPAAILPVLHHLLPIPSSTGFLISNITGVTYLVTLLTLVIYFFAKGVREAKVLLLSSILILLGGVTYGLALIGLFPMDRIFLNSFKIGAIAFSGNLLYGLFDRINSIQQDRLRFKIEQEKSDELLFNVLPKEVASELKEKGSYEAGEFDDISVLFTDFKDFTATAAQMSPRQLVDEINDCFRTFDQMAGKYGVEKIKTIGDSYMAAAGLRGNPKEKAADLVRMALEMQRFMQDRKRQHSEAGKPAFEMRAGIHTGPVVAGIVGEKKFQYDLWGDTVNTASRMESGGAAGKVNISRKTYELIKDCPDFVFEKRPEMEAKGKGLVEMWFVFFSE